MNSSAKNAVRMKSKDISGKRKKHEDDLYAVYKKQLLECSFDNKTVVSLAELGELNRLFTSRKHYEDITALMSIFVILLCFLLDDEMRIWALKHQGKLYHDTYKARILKWATSIDSIIIIILHTLRYKTIIRIKALRNILPRNTGLLTKFDSTETKNWILECFIALLHIPVGMDFYTNLNGYPMHVNVLNMYVFQIECTIYIFLRKKKLYLTLKKKKNNIFSQNIVVLFRIYTMLRVMRNHSGFYGQQIHFIANMNAIDSLSISFNFKMLLKYNPIVCFIFFSNSSLFFFWFSYEILYLTILFLKYFPKILLLLLPLLFTIVVATGAALCILEREIPTSKISSFHDGIYLVLITMPTVGYGNTVAVSPIGKITIILGGVLGGLVISTMMVAVFVEASNTSEGENYLINIVMRKNYKRELRHTASNCLQIMWLYRKYSKLASKGDVLAKANLREINHKFHDTINKLRVLRKCKPDDKTPEGRVSATSKLINNLMNALFGCKEEHLENQGTRKEMLSNGLLEEMKIVSRKQMVMNNNIEQIIKNAKSILNKIE